MYYLFMIIFYKPDAIQWDYTKKFILHSSGISYELYFSKTTMYDNFTKVR